MYKLEFKLKQHTPIIHFQHDQDGATLRATEVKPKLDRYLDYFAFDNTYDKIKTFLIGYSEKRDATCKNSYQSGRIALNYKVAIVVDSNNITIKEIPEKFPCYFGNMGDENKANPKKFSYCTSPIRLIFTSPFRDLLDQLEIEVPNFFARNNFGTRQSKGFGSFYIDESDSKYEDPALLSYFRMPSDIYEPKAIFKEIELVHKAIRSGINEIGPGGRHLFYMKPLIWYYFKKRNINWDKKAIKTQFFNKELNNQVNIYESTINIHEYSNWPITYKKDNYNLVKDLLGLSSIENWRVPYNSTITKKSELIDRFKSPIFYKPIRIKNRYRIYIDVENIPDEMYNSTFNISNNNKSFDITTPSENEFDITEFLSWAFSDANIEDCIQSEFSETERANRIIEIFTELNNNLNQ